MQWLIDIIQEWVQAQGYLTTGFVDRGDPLSHDYALGDFTKDGAWHDLNLSSIIPENAKGVALHVIGLANTTNASITLRKNGNTNDVNVSRLITVVAHEFHTADMIVALDTNRIIEYRITPVVWLALSATVKGWWL